MSPGGGAASLGIVLSQGPLPDLWPRIPRSPAPFTLRQTPRPGPPPGQDAPEAPLYPAIVPVQQQFSRPGLPERPNPPVL